MALWVVLEDEADIRQLTMAMFGVWGHDSFSFENGTKMWDWLDKVADDNYSDPLPELVLLDIRVPGKRGPEIAARMRKIPKLRHVVIVMMSAFPFSDEDLLLLYY